MANVASRPHKVLRHFAHSTRSYIRQSTVLRLIITFCRSVASGVVSGSPPICCCTFLARFSSGNLKSGGGWTATPGVTLPVGWEETRRLDWTWWGLALLSAAPLCTLSQSSLAYCVLCHALHQPLSNLHEIKQRKVWRVAVKMLETPIRQPASTSLSGPTPGLAEPFVFVPITGVEASKGRGAAKRIVRAHVTRVQHAKSSALSSTQDLQTWTVKPYIHRDTPNVRRKTTSTIKPPTKKAPALPTDSSTDSSSKDSDTTTTSIHDSAIVIVSPRLPNAAGGLADPFWSYPVDHQPELSPLFAHYIQNIAVEIADLDGPNEKGLIRKNWFPTMMQEAAPMYAVLLMSASHYAIVNPKGAALIDLLHLKARALAEINKTLADPKRGISDAMLAAVAKVAAYEAIFGDSATFTAHMKGLKMMLKMRGGYSTLGLNGLIERMILWIDLNAAHITGLERHLDGAFETKVSFAAPDPFHFAGIS